MAGDSQLSTKCYVEVYYCIMHLVLKCVLMWYLCINIIICDFPLTMFMFLTQQKKTRHHETSTDAWPIEQGCGQEQVEPDCRRHCDVRRRNWWRSLVASPSVAITRSFNAERCRVRSSAMNGINSHNGNVNTPMSLITSSLSPTKGDGDPISEWTRTTRGQMSPCRPAVAEPPRTPLDCFVSANYFDQTVEGDKCIGRNRQRAWLEWLGAGRFTPGEITADDGEFMIHIKAASSRQWALI